MKEPCENNKKQLRKVGYVADYSYLYYVKDKPTYDDLVKEIAVLKASEAALKASEVSLRQRIAYLERMLYGSKSDRIASKIPDNQPGLFDEFFKEAMDEKASQIEAAAREIEKEARKRRQASKKKAERPARYQYHGLEERATVLMPDGVAAEDCDVIGRGVTRVLRREPAKVWVEVIERPVLRPKADKNLPNPRIYQAPAPVAVIGGNHVGADLLSRIVIDKYRYHLPEYRQAKQYADLHDKRLGACRGGETRAPLRDPSRRHPGQPKSCGCAA